MEDSNQFHRRCTRFSSVESNVALIILSNVNVPMRRNYDNLVNSFGRVCSITQYTNTQQFLHYLKRSPPYQNVIVLLDDLNGPTIQNILTRLATLRKIKAILIFTVEAVFNEKQMFNFESSSSFNFNNIMEIFNSHEDLTIRLEQLITELMESSVDNDVVTTLNRKEKSFTNLKNELGSFLWIHSIKEILIRTPHNSPKAKIQFVKECRKLSRYNRRHLAEIKRFEDTYCTQDAIQWYTKPCFLFRIVNNVLRSRNPYYLYTFRYFIFDLSISLVRERPKNVDRLRLFRGAKIFRDEIEKITVDSLMAVNGFFSTSLNRRVAEAFIGLCPVSGRSVSLGRNDNIQYVIYDIDINLRASLDLVVAHACTQSYIVDEEEMIFDLGTTFTITQISYDEEHLLWTIQMTHSSEVAQLAQEYNAYIHERLKEFNAEILFGRILSTNLAEYSNALSLFHELLRTLPIDCEDRPKVYFELGRLYRFQGNHKKSIEYFHAARLLQRKRLPQWNFDYGATLAGLSTVYLEQGDVAAALTVLEQSKIFFREYPFDYNYETIFQANLFSYAYYLNHQYERALDLLNGALITYKTKMPLDHPSHAQAWHNLGLVHRALGHQQESLAAFKEALRMRMSRLDPEHPYIARTLYQMSLLYEELGDQQQAFDCAGKAVLIQKTKLPPKHDELKCSIVLYDRLASKQEHN